jgi:Ser/Thr protein kinase RdoA (MazF antagonist)
MWFYEAGITASEQIRAPRSGLAGSARKNVIRLFEQVWSLLVQHRGLVHTDFKADNLVVARDGLYVLDWEKATNGSQMFDLALALFHLLARRDWNDSRRAARAFLSSYAEVNPVEDFVVQELPRLIIYAGSIYFLIDAEIYARTSAEGSPQPADRRHASYYRRYCAPTYGRLLARHDLLVDAIARP